MRILIASVLVAGVAAADGPAPINVAPVVPPVFRLLADPAIQKEVGLTADQMERAAVLRQLLAAPAKPISVGLFGKVPAETVRASRIARLDAFLAEGLTKDQRTRLDQILFQLREKEFGRHMAFAMAARDLGLRPDQVDDVRGLKVLRVEEIAKTVASGQRFEKIKVEVEAKNGDTFDKMSEMLTRAQRERLKVLRGNGFEGKVDFGMGDLRRATLRYPARVFGLYDLELLYLLMPVVREELKLSESKAKLLRIPADEAAINYFRPDLVHNLTEKALKDHLTVEQLVRFDQIMMQRRATVSAEAVCSHPAAVSTLKLSPIQVRDLASGKSLKDVLGTDQLVKYQALLGTPFQLPANSDDAYIPHSVKGLIFNGDFAIARSFLRLTARLQLSPEQVKTFRDLADDEPKIRELIQKELSLDDTPPVVGSARSLTAVNAVSDHYRAAVEQQCWDVLDAPQKSLARQIFGRGK